VELVVKISIILIKVIIALMVAAAFIASVVEIQTLPEKKYLAKVTIIVHLLLLVMINMSKDSRDVLQCVLFLASHTIFIYVLGMKNKTANVNTAEMISNYSRLMIITDNGIFVFLLLFSALLSVAK
jgi:hypothetical protein